MEESYQAFWLTNTEWARCLQLVLSSEINVKWNIKYDCLNFAQFQDSLKDMC